jgi:predicted transcriptional regulator
MSIETTEHEKLVLTIVQDYLNQTRYFNMNKIIPFINSKLKMHSVDLNYRAIEEILRSLVKMRLIDEGTKFTKMDVLKNKTRTQIYNFILNNPGVYFNTIVRKLKINKPVIVWHINMLVRFEFITREEFENHEIYFDSNLSARNRKFRYFASKEESRKIMKYLKDNDYGITKTHLTMNLGMHHNTVTKYLKNLEDYNMVIKKKVAKRTLYFLNEEFIEALNISM